MDVFLVLWRSAFIVRQRVTSQVVVEAVLAERDQPVDYARIEKHLLHRSIP
jgi:hypothetical protein